MGAPLLYVTPYPPDRRDYGGAGWVDRRVLEVLGAGDRDVEVVAVTGPPGTSSAGRFAVRSDGDVPLQVRGSKRLLARVGATAVVRRMPYQEAKYAAFGGWKAAGELLRRRSEGRQVVTSGWSPMLLAARAGVGVDLHIAHNVDWVIAGEHTPPLVARVLREQDRLRRLELELLSGVGAVLALSRRDAATLRAHGVDAGTLPLPLYPRTRDGVPPTIGFIGSFAWPPNATAAAALVEEVLPALERLGHRPGLVLAGRGSERYAGHPQVQRAGWVDDEATFFDAVGLVVVPRFGSTTGVSIKLLEATEHDVQSVVPKEVADAIADASPWLLAETVDEMAAAIARWLDGPDRAALRAFAASATTERTAAALRGVLPSAPVPGSTGS